MHFRLVLKSSNTHFLSRGIVRCIQKRKYRDWQETRLIAQLSDMKQYVKKHPDRNLSFTVHVGDTQKVTTTNCSEFAYANMASILRKG